MKNQKQEPNKHKLTVNKSKSRYMGFNAIAETKESVGTSLKLLTSALTLVAGLAWSDAIKVIMTDIIQPALNDIFNDKFGNFATIITPFIYAVIITIVVVFMVNRIEKIEEKFKEPEVEE